MKLEEKVIEYFKQIPKDVLAKSLAVAIFRNGEIEDIHSNSNKNVTDEDMKILNKGVCNRIYELLQMIEDADVKNLDINLGFSLHCANEWDSPENKHYFYKK